MKKKHLTIIVIAAVVSIFAVISGIVYVSLNNEGEIYQDEVKKVNYFRSFEPPFFITDDVSGNENVDEDGITAYFKPGRNRIEKTYEYLNKELVKTSGWAIWGNEVYGLIAEKKYKMTVNMAIDSMPEDINQVVAKINTHPLGIQDGHHICTTPNDNTLEIMASDFDNINEFKEISIEFIDKDFTADEMIHNHKGKHWQEFNGLYFEGALELRVGWTYQKVGIKVREIKIERVE